MEKIIKESYLGPRGYSFYKHIRFAWFLWIGDKIENVLNRIFKELEKE
jgi:hypothetical protein